MTACIERTSYYARPGKAGEVLEVRREASAVRRRIGLEEGRILVRAEGSDPGPDVQWEGRFASRTARDADLAARAASEAFEAVRKRMSALLDRFERQVYEIEGEAAALDLSETPIAPEAVAFEGPRGRLTGFLYLPPGEGPFPCMVTNHGSTVTQDSDDLCKPSVAATLMSWGIACLYPNRWGYGRSPGRYWREEVTAEYGTDAYDTQLLARLDAEADDVVAARAYARTRAEIDPERVGVMGSSFGGTVSLLAGSKEPGFACVVDFAGAAMNWEKAPRLRARMMEAAGRIVRPLFLIQAENDFSIGPARDLAEHLRGFEYPVWSRIYPPFGVTPMEGHLFERHGPMIWGPEVRRFLAAYL